MDINDDIQKKIEDLKSSITKSHDELKKLVNKLYNQENPFRADRDDDTSSLNFAADVTKFKELIAYSILIGDPNILEIWAIIPLKAGKLHLVRSEHFEDYLEEFSSNCDYVKNINNDFQKFLVEQLLEALKVFGRSR